MPGFGSMVTGAGEGMQGYQQYQSNQLDQDQKRQQLIQTLQQAVAQQQAQQQPQKAAQQAQTMQPAGPGGSYSPQQLFQLTGGDPKLMEAYSQASRPAVMAGYRYSQQQAPQMPQQQMSAQQPMRQAPQMPQQQAPQMPTTRPVTQPSTRAGAPTMSPEEQMLRKKYATNPAGMYSDPGFVAARKKTIAMQTPAAKAAPAPAASPAKVTGDEDYDSLPPGSHFIGPDGVLRVKPDDAPNGAEFMNSADNMGSPTGPSN